MNKNPGKTSDDCGKVRGEGGARAEGTVAWESPILTKLPVAKAESDGSGEQDSLGGAHYS
jgi:hypothetical protein